MGMTGEQAYALAKKLIESSGGGGGTVDAYTKAQTDNLLFQKVDKEDGKGLFSGSYNDLTDAPTIPTKTSELTNDSRYMTEQAVSDEVNELNSNLDGLGYGENGAKNLFKDYDVMKSYKISSETYNGYPIIYSNERWNGAYQRDLILKSGVTYTISAYVKGNGKAYLYSSLPETMASIVLTDNFERFSFVYTPNEDVSQIRIENGTDGGLYIACFQIEEGDTATPYKPYIPSVKMLAEEVNQQNESLADYGLDNKFDGAWRQGYFDQLSGAWTTSPTDIATDNYISVKSGSNVKAIYDGTFAYLRCSYWNNDTYVGYVNLERDARDVNVTVPDNVNRIKFVVVAGVTVTPQTVGRLSVYINNAIDELKNDLSDEWTSKTYSVGDYCIYKNSMWRCLVANSVAPSEGSNWTRVTIGSELKRIIAMIN